MQHVDIQPAHYIQVAAHCTITRHCDMKRHDVSISSFGYDMITNQDAPWYGGRPQLRPHSARWGPISPSQKGGTAPSIFGPCPLWPNGWMDQDAPWYEGRPQSRPYCAIWGLNSSPQKGHRPQFLANVYCGQMVAHLSYC